MTTRLTLFKVSQTHYQTNTSQCECLTHRGLFFYTLLSPQDLKPSNLAVNEDCELKVRKKTLFTKTGLSQCDMLSSTHSVVITLLYIDGMNTAAVRHKDTGFRFGEAHR